MLRSLTKEGNTSNINAFCAPGSSRPAERIETMKAYVGAIDQGTSSTRFMVFDKPARIAVVTQKENEQIFPKPRWAEH
jgi:FGGY family of carbohydrate kinases, N-terminal domain